jgi:hypothetical protein
VSLSAGEPHKPVTGAVGTCLDGHCAKKGAPALIFVSADAVEYVASALESRRRPVALFRIDGMT